MLETQVTNSETSGISVTQNDVMVRTRLAFDLRRGLCLQTDVCLKMFANV